MLGFLSNRASAAHLALAAVAPLVFCKYFPADGVCLVLLWLALIVSVWAFMAPSLQPFERSPYARRRFIGSLIADPFFWTAVVLVVYSAVVALNSDIRLAYDAELKVWKLMKPAASVLPGAVPGVGSVHFAASVLVLVVYASVARSLGRAESVFFSILAPVFVVIDGVFSYAAGYGIPADCAVAYGLWSLVALSAMLSSEYARGHVRELVSSLALAGCFAALLFASRPVVACIFVGAALLITFVFIGFTFRDIGFSGAVRALALLFVAAALAALVYQLLSGDWEALIPVWKPDLHSALSRLAFRTWESAPWTGSGVGSFPLVAQIDATPEDWAEMGPMPDYGAFGWRLLLLERGMVGALAVLVSFAALFFSWFRGAFDRGIDGFAAAVPIFPVAVIAVSGCMVFESSSMQAGALVAFAALAAVSVNGGE